LYQFSHEIWATVGLSLLGAIFNQDVFPFDITEVSQPLAECLLRPRIFEIVSS
jgi:hypothetical protein